MTQSVLCFTEFSSTCLTSNTSLNLLTFQNKEGCGDLLNWCFDSAEYMTRITKGVVPALFKK